MVLCHVVNHDVFIFVVKLAFIINVSMELKRNLNRTRIHTLA